MKKKIIERIILGVVALAVAVVLTVIPLSSYTGYQNYLADVEAKQEELENKHKKPTLNSITAKLKDGFAYYANDIATAQPEHFDVIGNFTNASGKTYDEPITEGITVSTAADFYKVGGDVIITYRNKTATVSVQLLPVVLSKIEVATTPYSVKYQVGSTFSTDGMKVNAVYNDGTVKALKAGEYTVDKKGALTTGDKSVTISYTDGTTTKTTSVAIGVVQTLNNGAVKSIMIVDNKAVVNAGALMTTAQMEINAVYESGNRVKLAASDYTINATTATANFGKAYPLEVVYNADTTKKAKTTVTVRTLNQAENVFQKGGKVIDDEPEYAVVNGAIVKTGTTPTVVGDFGKTVLNGQEASIWRVFNCATETVASVTMRCGNSNLHFVNGTDKKGGYLMKPLQINTIMDVYINGQKVAIPSSVVLKGCGPASAYAALYGVYNEFTIPNVPLSPGENTIKFVFKSSTIGEKNCWNESPSTMNVDYFSIETQGEEIPENYTSMIKALEFAGTPTLTYNKPKANASCPMKATLTNGTKVLLNATQVKSLCTISVEGGSGVDYVEFAEYKVTIALKTNASIKAVKDVNVAKYYHVKVTKAEIRNENNRGIYVLTGECVGYEPGQFLFWDKLADSSQMNFASTVTTTRDSFTMKIDLTDVDRDKIYRDDLKQYRIYPHLSLNGSPYNNGGKASGDITKKYTSYKSGQNVEINGWRYTIKEEWDMPTILITKL